MGQLSGEPVVCFSGLGGIRARRGIFCRTLPDVRVFGSPAGHSSSSAGVGVPKRGCRLGIAALPANGPACHPAFCRALFARTIERSQFYFPRRALPSVGTCRSHYAGFAIVRSMPRRRASRRSTPLTRLCAAGPSPVADKCDDRPRRCTEPNPPAPLWPDRAAMSRPECPEIRCASCVHPLRIPEVFRVARGCPTLRIPEDIPHSAGADLP